MSKRSSAKNDPIETALFGVMNFGDLAKDLCCLCSAPTKQTLSPSKHGAAGRAIMNARRGRSLSRQNLVKLLDLLRSRALQTGVIKADNRLSSHDLRALFTGKADNVKFHPMDEYPLFYSEQEPNVAITYRWDTNLQHDFPRFLDEFEKACQTRKDMAYWIDIFFVDQNQRDLDSELDKTVEIIRFSEHHAVFMKNHTLFSGWCNLEIAARTKRVMDATRMSPEDIAREVISLDDSGFSKLIMLPNVPDLYEDLFDMSRDVYDTLVTSDKADRAKLQNKIIDMFGSKDLFNHTMQCYKRAAIERYKRTHPIDAAIRHAALGDM
jgi:hypothetical protein